MPKLFTDKTQQMSRLFKMSLLVFIVCTALMTNAQNVVITSPDRKNTVEFKIDNHKDNAAFYSVKNQGKVILAESPLGFEFENQKPLRTNLQIVSKSQRSVNSVWKPVYGEKSQYTDHFNEVIIQLKETSAPGRLFSLTFRAYNEGIAFKYNFKTDQPVIISRELTGFQFDKDYTSWIARFAQDKYTKGSVSKTGKGCERPYVLEMNPKCYIALGEAALIDNARMKFDRAEKDSLLLLAGLDGKPSYSSSFSTPWRYVMIAGSPGKLLENNFFILNLNAPCAIADVSWIRPGKVIREATLTTTGAMACIDFAVVRHLQYIEFDAGWYGPETDRASDATAVKIDPARSKGPLALREVIEYGKSKNIGVILYVNQNALTQQLDTILPLYQSWGVKGVKYGFVNVGSQQATTWLHEAVRKAAKYRLMVDIHDEYRPTGFSRTYPNLLTQEGVRGNEEMPDGDNNTTLPFTRFVAGAADATICYYHRKELKPWIAANPKARMVENTCCHQMALSVINYSPFQFLYWYDSPKDAQGEPELDFFDQVPTVWDDTKVLKGNIGENVVIARKKGNDWFVGAITNNGARKMDLRLDFLDQGKNYELVLYTDGDEKVKTRTHVKIEKVKVTSKTNLNLDFLPRGGCAMIIKKLN